MKNYQKILDHDFVIAIVYLLGAITFMLIIQATNPQIVEVDCLECRMP